MPKVRRSIFNVQFRSIHEQSAEHAKSFVAQMENCA